MSFQTWLLFVSATLLISATPGANMLLVFQFGLNYGLEKKRLHFGRAEHRLAGFVAGVARFRGLAQLKRAAGF